MKKWHSANKSYKLINTICQSVCIRMLLQTIDVASKELRIGSNNQCVTKIMSMLDPTINLQSASQYKRPFY